MPYKPRKTSRGEYFDPGCEFFDPGREFNDEKPLFPVGSPMRGPQEEFFDPGKEFFETEPGSGGRRKDKKPSKNVMTVLIAAVVAAVGISTAGAAVPAEPGPLPEPATEIAEPTAAPAPTAAPTPRPKPSPSPTAAPPKDYSFLDGLFAEVYEAVCADDYTGAAAIMESGTRDIMEKLAEDPGYHALAYDGEKVSPIEQFEGEDIMRAFFVCIDPENYKKYENGSSSDSPAYFKFLVRDGSGFCRSMYYSGGFMHVLRGAFSPSLSCEDAVYESFGYAEGETFPPYTLVSGMVVDGHFTGDVTMFSYGYEQIHFSGSLLSAENRGWVYLDLGSDGALHLDDLSWTTTDGTSTFDVFRQTNYRYVLDTSRSPACLNVKEFMAVPSDNSVAYHTWEVSGGATRELFGIGDMLEVFEIKTEKEKLEELEKQDES